MLDNSGTILVTGTFKKGYELYFDEYSDKIRTFLKKHEGLVVRRQLLDKQLYGHLKSDLYMIIDFPTGSIAEKIFFEEDYLALIPLRERIFEEFNMYVADTEKSIEM